MSRLTDKLPRPIMALLPAMALFLVSSLMSAAAQDNSGLSIYSASTRLYDDIYHLNAEIDYQLTQDVIEALESGVAITFEVEIEFYKPRKLVWNNTIASLSQRYRIEYQALTQQYVVTNINSGAQNNYLSRTTVLLSMGRISDLPLLDKDLLPDPAQTLARLRVVLLINELPAPMRPWAFIDRDWRLKSEWLQWKLE